MEQFTTTLTGDGSFNCRVQLIEQSLPPKARATTPLAAVHSLRSEDEQISEQVLQCDSCPRKYRSATALNMHRSKIHGYRSSSKGSIRCQETSCNFIAKSVSDLREHLTIAHKLQFKLIRTEFSKSKAFDRWRAQVEQTECVCFVMKKSKVTPVDRHRYFYCQKSALCSVNNKNVNCTAQLLVKEDLRTGLMSVSGCLTHYGHSMTTRQFVESISKRPRLKEGGVAGQDVDMSTISSQLLAIYELAVTKKKQKSVDKICAALRDLYDCLKDYDEDDETLPGLEETQAWRRTAAREVAEQERESIANSGLDC